MASNRSEWNRRQGNTEEDALGPQPPHSKDAERIVITTILYDNTMMSLVQLEDLEVGDFYYRAHQFVFEVMVELFDEGQEIDTLLIIEKLRAKGMAGHVGGVEGLTEITKNIPIMNVESQIKKYVKTLKDLSWLRTIQKTARMIEADCTEPGAKLEDVAALAETSILEVVSAALRGNKKLRNKGFIKLKDDKESFRTMLEARHKGLITALPTGIKPIDRMLEGGGLNPQGQYLLAANPKAGKTSLALKISGNVAKWYVDNQIRKSVAVISLEMRREALHTRMFSQYTQIPYSRLTQPGFGGADYEVAMASVDSFFDTFPLWFSDSMFDLNTMWRKTEELVLGEAQLGFLVIDYVQLVALKKGGALDAEGRTAEVTVISREIKHMAQEFNLPILGISSLSRAGFLRESGALDYDCECLLSLENPDWSPQMTREQKAALNAKKVWDINANIVYQRNGPTGEIPLKFLREYMQFLDPEDYLQSTRNGAGPNGSGSSDLDSLALWNSIQP